ncbi:unnamed protein product [Paramecium octaurelia]|uniref:Uncharacterized protein n=1 Tax=Paramecium octaurelia TaxID=43137 RepID=A0A8S1T279_PAROT|nr:unnamed protein product [Paramecium octaurelia]
MNCIINSYMFIHSKELYGCSLKQLDQETVIALSTFGEGTQELLVLSNKDDNLQKKSQISLDSKFVIQLMLLNELIVVAGESFQIFKYSKNKIDHLVDLQSNEVISCFDNVDNQKIISGSIDSILTIWDINTQKPLSQTQVFQNQEIYDLSLSADGNVGSLITNKNGLFRFDVRLNQIFPFQTRQSLKYSKINYNKFDNSYVMAIDQENGIIDLYDTRQIQQTCQRIRCQDIISNADWLMNSLIISACQEGNVEIIEMDTHLKQYQIRKEYTIDNMQIYDNIVGLISANHFGLIYLKK